jgi:hypothetical protein
MTLARITVTLHTWWLSQDIELISQCQTLTRFRWSTGILSRHLVTKIWKGGNKQLSLLHIDTLFKLIQCISGLLRPRSTCSMPWSIHLTLSIRNLEKSRLEIAVTWCIIWSQKVKNSQRKPSTIKEEQLMALTASQSCDWLSREISLALTVLWTLWRTTNRRRLKTGDFSRICYGQAPSKKRSRSPASTLELKLKLNITAFLTTGPFQPRWSPFSQQTMLDGLAPLFRRQGPPRLNDSSKWRRCLTVRRR